MPQQFQLASGSQSFHRGPEVLKRDIGIWRKPCPRSGIRTKTYKTNRQIRKATPYMTHVILHLGRSTI